jgi:hypothetical protein
MRHVTRSLCAGPWLESLKKRDKFEDLDIAGKVILNYNLKKWSRYGGNMDQLRDFVSMAVNLRVP